LGRKTHINSGVRYWRFVKSQGDVIKNAAEKKKAGVERGSMSAAEGLPLK
jgi:hypothetical protein